MKSLNERMVPIHCSVERNVYEWLEKKAAEDDRTVAQYIRKILNHAHRAEHPQGNGTQDPKKQQARARV